MKKAISPNIDTTRANINGADEMFGGQGFDVEFVPALGKVGVHIRATDDYVLFDPDKAMHAKGIRVRYEDLGNGPARGTSSHPIEDMGSAFFNEIVTKGREEKAKLKIEVRPADVRHKRWTSRTHRISGSARPS